MARNRTDIKVRFETHYTRGEQNECWEWNGSRGLHGYGSIFVEHTPNGATKYALAHRVSWEIHNNAKIPPGLVIMHTCDNPPCVNPAHLKLGTQTENTLDRDRKGRGKKSKLLKYLNR